MPAVQMNTRIDANLKAQGDAVFADFGYSPSEAVRLLWGFAVRNKHNKKAITNMLSQLDEPQNTKATKQTAAQKQAACKEWVQRWDSSLQSFFSSTGCNQALFQPTTNENLDEVLNAIQDENAERISLGLSREEYDILLAQRWKA